MPAQKSKKPAQAAAKSKTVVKAPAAKKAPAPAAVPKAASKVIAKAPAKKPTAAAGKANLLPNPQQNQPPKQCPASPKQRPSRRLLSSL